MRIPLLFILAACVLASSASANDGILGANLEIRTMLGAAGRPAQATDEFEFANGAYVCRNAATRSTPHIVRFPFTLPDTRMLNWVNVQGRRTSIAPPLTLSVRKACESQSEVSPTATILVTATPSPDIDGYFSTNMFLGGERPENLDCKYWMQAEFNISSIKCTTGQVYIQKFRVENTIFDRIFRGSFHTNITTDAP